ncbi:flagellar hook-associated protein 1 [Weizmannia acidilactici]|uniref:Flagellar hook-associated protein 1 n=1 Tax=Weizmannia acidilactici TaxID=2607726 RepID=A0A5J4JIF0_9BACI|nr:flagellar hook-associated protein FlgK [Weizmannia acidilactici]GER68774.1 flagellar hook-associated protein 1 [Weizmannia acidilactici]GER72941.1 flagellar hook-associated protein 1 [Weizmannia acidilactici]
MSTFFGLETAKRALAAQQNALYTVGQNVANANTEGYTRQRVNLTATDPYPAASMNRPAIAGQIGTGVEAGEIQRIRDKYLDVQYRENNSKLGYWTAKSDALSKMESVMDETDSDSSLSNTMEAFWESLQDLSTNPEDVSARSVVLERGKTLTDTLHYLSETLSQDKKDVGSEISVSVNDINSILEQISDLNKQIAALEPNGYLPNDLYDKRDILVDKLSSYLNITVETEKSGGNAKANADGIYNIKMMAADGTSVYLVQGSSYNSVEVQNGVDSDGDNIIDSPPASGEMVGITVGGIQFAVSDANGNVTFPQGKLLGLIESYGYQYTDANGNTVEAGTYPEMLDSLDKLAYTFGTVFNAVHEKGTDLEGNAGTAFFTFGSLTDYKGAADAISVNSSLTYSKIAASANGDPGDGSNAINLASVEDFDLSSNAVSLEGFSSMLNIASLGLPFTTGTINSNYEGIIGKLGVDAERANNLEANSSSLLESVETNRQSVSSVSLDEELTNMIKYQQAYNAAARMITMNDELLDKIISGMGVVGR